ncbi:MAG: DMT family transporter [Hyphomicrobiaceae bacterium]|nr:DMT family transporter [Hyphomicrobiaceae bacterium]
MSRAIILAIAADGILSLMDALIKSLTTRYPTFQIAFLRFASGLVCATLLLGLVRPGWPGRETVVYNATRSLLVVVTATSFFYALSQLPLADAVALSFLSPMFIAVFGAVFLKERVDSRIVLALLAGFAGMMLIAGARVGAGDYTDGAIYGTAACVVAAVAYALTLVLLRARALRDAISIIVWFQNLGPALLLAPAAALVWTPPSLPDLGMFVLIGLMGVAGHLLLASAFARAEAARLAPVHYTTLVWGVIFGYVLFAEVPGGATLAGAGLIVLGTVATHRRKRKPPKPTLGKQPA